LFTLNDIIRDFPFNNINYTPARYAVSNTIIESSLSVFLADIRFDAFDTFGDMD